MPLIKPCSLSVTARGFAAYHEIIESSFSNRCCISGLGCTVVKSYSLSGLDEILHHYYMHSVYFEGETSLECLSKLNSHSFSESHFE